MLSLTFEEHKPAGMIVFVSEVTADVDTLVRHAVHPNLTSRDASKKEIRRHLRQLFRKNRLPVTGEPLGSALSAGLRQGNGEAPVA